MKRGLTFSQSDSQELKRKKGIRSCLFCRKRKLKCDKQRPACASCKKKNSSLCVYVDNDNESNENNLLSNISSLIDEKLQKIVSNNTFQERANNIENLIRLLDKKVSSHGEIISIGSEIPKDDSLNLFENKITNPLYSFTHFEKKSSGRRIIYGPTSTRTYAFRDRSGFGEKFQQLIAKIELERHKWKQINEDKSRILESQLIELPYEDNIDNLLAQVCKCLPSHAECLRILNKFFDPVNDELYHMNRILDKTKVFKDYFNSFVQSTTKLTTNGERPIESLQPIIKKNFYTIGIILTILCIVKFGSEVPSPIRKSLTILSGQASANSFYVERAQFLTLRCTYKRFHMTDGDDTHMVNLIGLTTDTAMAIGLDKNIRELFKDQENVVGTLESLENLWHEILLLDVESSFQMGKSLGVTNAIINLDTSDISLQHTNDAYYSYRSKLQKFLILARPMLAAICRPQGKPDLKLYCNKLLNYWKEELGPVSNFTDEVKMHMIPIRDIRIFNICLQMILGFSSLNFTVLNNKTVELKNAIIQSGLVLLKVNSLLLRRGSNLDKKFHENLLSGEIKSVTPYIHLFLFMTSGMVPRVSSVFCPMMYEMLTSFKGGFIFSPERNENRKWDFTCIANENNKPISLLDAFDAFCELISEWANPVDDLLKKVLEKSEYMNVIFNIEQICRTIINKTFEVREQTEISWANRDTSMDPMNVPLSKYRLNGSREMGETNGSVHIVTSSNMPNNGLHYNSLLDASACESEEPFQSMSNEFWSNYNFGWDEMMSKAYTDKFLNSL